MRVTVALFLALQALWLGRFDAGFHPILSALRSLADVLFLLWLWRRVSRVWRPALAGWGLYLGGMGLSSLFSIYHRASLEAWVEALRDALLGLGVLGAVEARKGWRSWLEAVWMAALLVLAVGYGQWLTADPATYPYLTETHRVRIYASMNQPNNLAGFLSLLLPSGLALALAHEGRKRLFWSACALAALGAQVLTYSRGGYLATLGGLGIFLALAAKRAGPRKWERRMAWALAAAGVCLFLLRGTSPVQRLLTLLNWRHSTTQDRLLIWRTAWRMGEARPGWGWGPGTFWLAYPVAKEPQGWPARFTHAHQWYLHLLAEQGWVGLGLSLLLWGTWVARGWRLWRDALEPEERLLRAGLLGGLGGFFLSGLFDFHMGIPSIRTFFWVLLGLTAASEGEGGTRERPKLRRLLGCWTPLALLAIEGYWGAGHWLYWQGWERAQRGHWEEALSAFRQAAMWDAGNAVYWGHVGHAYARLALQGQPEAWQEALRAYGRACALAPEDAFLWHARAWAAWQSGQRALALALERAAMERDPNQPLYLTDYGWMLEQMGRVEEAHRVWRGGQVLWPGTWSLTFLLADSLARHGQPQEALEVLHHQEPVVPLDWRDHVRHFILGYGRLGVDEDFFSTRPHWERWEDLRQALEALKARLRGAPLSEGFHLRDRRLQGLLPMVRSSVFNHQDMVLGRLGPCTV